MASSCVQNSLVLKLVYLSLFFLIILKVKRILLFCNPCTMLNISLLYTYLHFSHLYIIYTTSFWCAIIYSWTAVRVPPPTSFFNNNISIADHISKCTNIKYTTRASIQLLLPLHKRCLNILTALESL